MTQRNGYEYLIPAVAPPLPGPLPTRDWTSMEKTTLADLAVILKENNAVLVSLTYSASNGLYQCVATTPDMRLGTGKGENFVVAIQRAIGALLVIQEGK